MDPEPLPAPPAAPPGLGELPGAPPEPAPPEVPAPVAPDEPEPEAPPGPDVPPEPEDPPELGAPAPGDPPVPAPPELPEVPVPGDPPVPVPVEEPAPELAPGVLDDVDVVELPAALPPLGGVMLGVLRGTWSETLAAPHALSAGTSSRPRRAADRRRAQAAPGLTRRAAPSADRTSDSR